MKKILFITIISLSIFVIGQYYNNKDVKYFVSVMNERDSLMVKE